MSLKKAVNAIDKHGALLVFPIKNKKEPLSLWSVLHPRSEMRWEWDDAGDGRVFELWRLREELSRSGQVIYCKWYQGRATLFSKEVVVNLLSYFQSSQSELRGLSREAKEILEALEMDSPLSTKQIKEIVSLQGRWLEASYNRSMKQLWSRLLVVVFGEIEDSSFPSLAIGATQNLFESLWLESKKISSLKAEAFLKNKLGEDNKFYEFAKKLNKSQVQ